ncbi:hypothetical protein O181_038608 [Austropuccinia psidii MF-1]|uniref:Uncharacterized protein n=1 Tax=Austropuccinia psidii MF-1 TaxID=1389203 RepID=A0A9Q3HB59_9BASI|nr:hypothetical protein [Austropuccinia psidii MF-1]
MAKATLYWIYVLSLFRLIRLNQHPVLWAAFVYYHILYNSWTSNQASILAQFKPLFIILLLESTFLALDNLNYDIPLCPTTALRQIAIEFLGVIFRILNLLLSTLLLIFVKKRREKDIRIFNTIKITAKAIVVSLVPGVVLQSVIVIFQDSYGTLPPTLVSTPISNFISSTTFSAWFLKSSSQQLALKLNYGVGIDMDQLGSKELKQALIRCLMGYLSCSMAVATALRQPWIYGVFLLAGSWTQKLTLKMFVWNYVGSRVHPDNNDARNITNSLMNSVVHS